MTITQSKNGVKSNIKLKDKGGTGIKKHKTIINKYTLENAKKIVTSDSEILRWAKYVTDYDRN